MIPTGVYRHGLFSVAESIVREELESPGLLLLLLILILIFFLDRLPRHHLDASAAFLRRPLSRITRERLEASEEPQLAKIKLNSFVTIRLLVRCSRYVGDNEETGANAG